MKQIGEEIPHLDLGGDGNTLHFAHANAYPPGCYRELLSLLGDKHRILASEARPLWQDAPLEGDKSWVSFADDLIRFLDSRKESGIIGVGHSMGAVVTLIAAVKRPDLFSKIILIEPVLLHRNLYRLSGLMPLKLRRLIIPPIKIAEKRRNFWSSREEAFKSFRKKKVFRLFSDSALQNYISSGLTSTKDGFKLRFSPEWEARVYAIASSSWALFEQLSMPSLSIRAEETNAIFSNSWQEWQKLNNNGQFVTISQTTHLLPFEVPQQLSKLVLHFIESGQTLP
ncbi:MAG: alpha/beta fold hydrolase [Calditrichia bacterium]